MKPVSQELIDTLLEHYFDLDLIEKTVLEPSTSQSQKLIDRMLKSDGIMTKDWKELRFELSGLYSCQIQSSPYVAQQSNDLFKQYRMINFHWYSVALGIQSSPDSEMVKSRIEHMLTHGMIQQRLCHVITSFGGIEIPFSTHGLWPNHLRHVLQHLKSEDEKFNAGESILVQFFVSLQKSILTLALSMGFMDRLGEWTEPRRKEFLRMWKRLFNFFLEIAEREKLSKSRFLSEMKGKFHSQSWGRGDSLQNTDWLLLHGPAQE